MKQENGGRTVKKPPNSLNADKTCERPQENNAAEAELNAAALIQTGILTDDFPDNESYAVYADLNPAATVGGDFYDYFLADDTHLVIVIGDVSGSGFSPAMFMMLTKTLIKVYAQSGYGSDKVLEHTNRFLNQSNPENFFVTCWLGIIDLTKGILSYTNAGHQHPVIVRKGEEPEYLLSDPNFVLGTKRSVDYREKRFKLSPGDQLILYTNGVTEAQSPEGEFFGDERLLAVIGENKNQDMPEIVKAIRTCVDAFEAGNTHSDDATVLALSFRGCISVPPVESKEFFLTKDSYDSVTGYIAERCAAEGCDENAINQIVIASSEILANIESYAYEDGGSIEIITKCRSHRMFITFKDNAPPFNPLLHEEPDVTLPLKNRRSGGLGIFIVKKLMSDVSYKYENNQNTLTIEKEF